MTSARNMYDLAVQEGITPEILDEYLQEAMRHKGWKNRIDWKRERPDLHSTVSNICNECDYNDLQTRVSLATMGAKYHKYISSKSRYDDMERVEISLQAVGKTRKRYIFIR